MRRLLWNIDDKTAAAVVLSFVAGVVLGVILANTLGQGHAPAAAEASPPGVDEAALPRPAAPAGPVQIELGTHVVTGVVAGDVVSLEEIGMIRLLGLDSRSLPDRPDNAHRTRKALEKLVQGKRVTVHCESGGGGDTFKDEDGTTLAYLLLEDGRDVNLELIRMGAAFADLGRQYSRRDDYLKAEREARLLSRGLWEPAMPVVAPPDSKKVEPPRQIGRNDVLVTPDGRFHRQSCPAGKSGIPMSPEDARSRRYLACPQCHSSPKVKA